MQLLDGRATADKILTSVKQKTCALKSLIGLGVIVVGENPASASYVRQKRLAAEKVGFNYIEVKLPESVSEKRLLAEIAKLNNSKKIHGFIIQLPLPRKINVAKILQSVNPEKDVDGFHPINLGKCLAGLPALLPATPAGILMLLDTYEIPLQGKEITVVGHSNIVGKPLAALLINRNATVTVCHQYTRDLAAHTRNADIVISATGVPNLIKASMVKKGVIAIDVGCAKVGDKLVGDIDFAAVSKKAAFITPVPGGVGPMTVATLIYNTYLAATKKI
ncbi:MAG: bifunctional 5,10-methylenetetrahydrofolate dehydrogenase/5,10-methenyltetrahydrofolate cyclohydrolase [Candidatus Gracilibacteria bacterium]|jgi:methylenetetrahydrofolate dehydrogenase (NADP+)/methenyltetrahydrofolate cyclohydrolase